MKNHLTTPDRMAAAVRLDIPLESETRLNTAFRRVVFTGSHLQVVLMSLRPGEHIGAEVHAHVDQFFRVEQGTARFDVAGRAPVLIHAGDAFVIPARTHHDVSNAGRNDLKLYTIYAPPNHPPGAFYQRNPG